MRTMKKMAIALVLILVICIVAGCQESDKSKYEKAQSLMAKGEYAEAAAAFDALGSYEESGKLSMYCKAAAAGESGDYDTAISGFTTLGDYKESTFMVTYYEARKYEANVVDGDWINWGNLLRAAETYDTIALFRDSKERAESCRQTAYDYAVAWAGEERYSAAIQVLDALGDFSDSKSLSKYYSAFRLEKEGKILEASDAFKALGDYKDSAEQADAVLKRCYDRASALEESGDQEGAYELFIYLGDYNDSFERANKPYYDLGIEKRDAGEWDAAVAAFTHAGTYSDASEQILVTRYDEGTAKRAEQDWDGAIIAFTQAGSYADAEEQILATRYAEGEAEYAKKDFEGAAIAFKLAEKYHDAEERVKEARYAQGEEKRAEQDWDGAEAAFRQAGNYSDAREQIKETRYQKADFLEQSGDQIGAFNLFVSLGQYKDSYDRAYKPYYEMGMSKREAGEWDDAVAAFKQAGNYSDAKTQIKMTRYAEGEAKLAMKDWDGAIAAFKQAGDYSDASEKVEECQGFASESIYLEGCEILKSGDYDSAMAIWKPILSDSVYVDKVNNTIYEYGQELVKQNKILTARNLLRKVDDPRCDILAARIESFICSLFVPNYSDQFILKPNGTIVDFNGNVIDRNVLKMEYRVYLVRIMKDGTVRFTDDDDYEWATMTYPSWRDIIDLQCEVFGFAGLTKDGHVKVDIQFRNPNDYASVNSWNGIVQIAICDDMVYGLKNDGTVVEAGERNSSTLSTSDWRDIAEIASNGQYLHGLKKDGSIVSTAKDSTLQRTSWSSVLMESVGAEVRVNPDGTTPSEPLKETQKRYSQNSSFTHSYESEVKIYQYLIDAKNCLAITRGSAAWGIIKHDGTLIYLSRNGISEASWKLWHDETELGELYNLQQRYWYNLDMYEPKSSSGSIAVSGKTKYSVNMRITSSSRSDSIMRVPSDTIVVILDTTTNDKGETWYQVKVDDKTGYINSDFIELD